MATDSNALIRLRNLELLLDRYEGSESARLAANTRWATVRTPSRSSRPNNARKRDPDPERILNDPKAEHQLRYQSLERLVGLVDLDTAIAILLNIVDNEPTLKTTALVTLASVGFDPGADVLASLWQTKTRKLDRLCASHRGAGRSGWLNPLEFLLSQDPEHDVVTLILQALSLRMSFPHSSPHLPYP